MKDKDKIQWNKNTKMFRTQASVAIVTGNISNFILFHFIFVRPPDSVRKPVTRWTRLTRWLGEFPTKHSVRKIITRWEDPWLRGRQWTRWLGEFPTKDSVRKIIPRSRTRWENPQLDELGGLGENMRTLGHSSTNSVRFVAYSVLGQICETDSVSFRSSPSHCVRGSLGFKKK